MHYILDSLASFPDLVLFTIQKRTGISPDTMGASVSMYLLTKFR